MKSSWTTFEPAKLIGKVYNTFEVILTPKDSIYYSFSIGCNEKDPLNKEHFKFTYENDEAFQTFPTMASALGVQDFGDFSRHPDFPEFNLDKLLHAEQSLEILKPLKNDSSRYLCVQKYLDFQDKGKLTIMTLEETFSCALTGELHVRIIDRSVLRGAGGFGFKGTAKSVLKLNKPDRVPDMTAVEPIRQDQAIIYRLNGDKNKLHIDPKVAKNVGFDRPILHGLCFYGISARAVIDRYSEGDPSRV